MAPYAIKSVIALCEKLLCDFLHCYADCERMYKSIVLVLFLINFVTGLGLGPRCLLHMNQCVTHCPRSMHPYHTRCDTDTISQKTCAFPEVYTLGYTCGWSRCDCNGDLVMDDDGVCIDYKYCIGMGLRRRKMDVPGGSTRKKRKKIRIKPVDEFATN